MVIVFFIIMLALSLALGLWLSKDDLTPTLWVLLLVLGWVCCFIYLPLERKKPIVPSIRIDAEYKDGTVVLDTTYIYKFKD